MVCHLLLLSPLAGLLLFAVLPFPTALALYLPLAALALAIGIPAVRAMYGPVATGVEGTRGNPHEIDGLDDRSQLPRGRRMPRDGQFGEGAWSRSSAQTICQWMRPSRVPNERRPVRTGRGQLPERAEPGP